MMKIYRMDDNWNKVSTREELLSLLDNYRGILRGPISDYLESMIDLDFSIIEYYMPEDDRASLSELDIYKKIAIYNIYNRAINLFQQDGDNLRISGNNDGIEGLTVYAPIGSKEIKLFSFNYGESQNTKIPDGYKSLNIGDVNLFQTVENEKQREAALTRIMNELEKLYNATNPFPSRPGVYGGPSSTWAMEHARRVKQYEEMFSQLDSKKGLTDEDKMKIEITKKYHDLLLEDFGLTNKSFTDYEEQDGLQGFDLSSFYEVKNGMNKTFVKRMPNLTIKNNINYV